ncbi:MULTISPECIES: hypothetical protein [Meiothermus]|jgi:hypothetical protein|nr:MULTISPECIES: hypothetical protein [Meiothermus]
MSVDLAHTLWLAHLAAYQSRQHNLAVFFECELFEERLARYRGRGV